MNDNFDQQRLGNASQVFGSTSDDTALPFKDKYTTEEQKQRDTEVTRLLAAYVKTYEKKTERNARKQDILFYSCLAIIVIFTIIFVAAIIVAFLRITSVSYTGLATIITASVSFIALVIGLLTIITKYFFPENDEQYITTIVETIQQNDLENKRENAKNSNTLEDVTVLWDFSQSALTQKTLIQFTLAQKMTKSSSPVKAVSEIHFNQVNFFLPCIPL